MVGATPGPGSTFEELRLEGVRRAMEDHFGQDARRIRHALRVTDFARQLLEQEEGEAELVLATALLHDVGIREAERKYGSSAGPLQEQEGPPLARAILESLGYPPAFIDEVCSIIASHHSPGEVDTANFRLVWDADWLVNLPDECNLEHREHTAVLIDRIFLTSTGAGLARNLYLKR